MTSTLGRRLAFWALPLLALLLGLAWMFRPVPVPVDLVAVQRGPLQVSVGGEGETRVRDIFTVSAPIPGLMRRIELEVGDAVRAETTVIARIEPSDPAFLDPRSAAEARAARDAAAAARTHAQAQVKRARAELDFAAVDHERIQFLAERDAISKGELDAAKRRLRTAAAALEEARAGLRIRESEYAQAQARLLAPRQGDRGPAGCIEVRSPVSGSVLRVATQSEGVVQAGAPLVEIGDPARLEIVVDLLSAEAVRVNPGQRAIVEAWGGDRALEATVRRVEPYGFTKVSALGIEEQRVNVILDLAEPRERWVRLGHGYRVEPRIVLWEASSVLRIPRAAIFRQGERWAVFVERGGRAELRSVEIGHDNGLETEIVSGLAAGERLVLHPSERVTEGARLVERR